jgi:hypothetical protein
MKKKSPDILWVFAAIFVAGLLFSAVSEGGAGSSAGDEAAIGYVAER